MATVFSKQLLIVRNQVTLLMFKLYVVNMKVILTLKLKEVKRTP